MDICLLKVKAYTTTHVYYMVTRKVRVHEVQILTFFDVSSYQDILPKNKKKGTLPGFYERLSSQNDYS